MLRAFCDAVEQRNGQAFSELFTEDGVYHDVFYGAFAGRAKIAELIDDWFYRTATDFRWDMHDPVSDGETLYARYTFSYRSTPADPVRRGFSILLRTLWNTGCPAFAGHDDLGLRRRHVGHRLALRERRHRRRPDRALLVIEPAFADRDAVGSVMVDHVEADP